jgi:hypothetical protein
MIGQRMVIGVAAVGLAALPGCYGSTEPATNVGPETATLNARGTANNGPATTTFSYWLTGSNLPNFTTPPRSWPAGASGPFTEKVSGLAAGSSYSFQVCGRDDNGGSTACAQTRTFTTQPPVEDGAIGGFVSGCCYRFSLDAHSSATGANPRGTVHTRNSSGTEIAFFDATVTCLVVNGNRAAIGSVGKLTTQPPSTPRDETSLVTIVDNRLERDTFNEVVTNGTTPPNCANASFANQNQLNIPADDFVVNDAPGSTPTAR